MAHILADNKAERLAVCNACPFREGNKCLKCGCNINLKTHFKLCSCPMEKWGPNCDIK